MARVFLTAPFDAPDVVMLICPDILLTPAVIPGFRQGVAHGGVPWLVADPGQVATGAFADLDQASLARLTHVAQVLGAPWRSIEAEGEDVLVFAADHVASDADFPAADLAALLSEAIPEILSYRGRLSMPEIAARRQMILSRAGSRLAARIPEPSDIRSAQSSSEVQVSAIRVPHEGYFLTRQYDLRHPVFAGGMSDEISREVFVAADAALVLPYDPVLDRLLLVEQFRMGPFGRGDPKPWVLEPVAGRVDPGETPETCAARECVEEAHLSLKALEHISSHYCSPGCSTEVFHCFVGLCNLEARNGGLGGLEVEHEDIATHVMSFDDAMALTQNGEINIGPLLLMLLWLQRERPRLRTFA
ncbi:MAG: NUDIX domain-containing protein [Pseudomonadota bacterium]